MKYKVYIRRSDTGHDLDVLTVDARSKDAAERKGAKAARALHTSGDYQIFAEPLSRKRRK